MRPFCDVDFASLVRANVRPRHVDSGYCKQFFPDLRGGEVAELCHVHKLFDSSIGQDQVTLCIVETSSQGIFQDVMVLSTDSEWPGRPVLPIQVRVRQGGFAADTRPGSKRYFLDFRLLHDRASTLVLHFVCQWIVSLNAQARGAIVARISTKAVAQTGRSIAVPVTGTFVGAKGALACFAAVSIGAGTFARTTITCATAGAFRSMSVGARFGAAVRSCPVGVAGALVVVAAGTVTAARVGARRERRAHEGGDGDGE